MGYQWGGSPVCPNNGRRLEDLVMLCLQFYLGQIVAQKLNGLALRCLILSTNLCKLHVESHLLRQHADIVEKVRLHVTPHVWKPPKLMPVLQQHVVAFILLLCTCKNTYTFCWSVIVNSFGQKIPFQKYVCLVVFNSLKRKKGSKFDWNHICLIQSHFYVFLWLVS